jgi:hypothetical protein
MAKDQLGLALTGSASSARAYDRAVSDYWALTGDPVGALKQALQDDPAFALGAAAIAGFFLVGGFRGDHPEVTGAIAAAERALPHASDRERLHLEAVKAWADGRSIDATLAWESILIDYPVDALALRLVEDAYFFLGQSAAIRDSVARVLPAWDRGHPLTSFVLGAYAFGLEETGELGRAEETAREALALNRSDSWATHALAHVLETRGSVQEGIAFLTSTRIDWSKARFMAGHNGWHLALFLIEQGRLEEVLAGYDRFTAPRLADDMTLDRCDAAALLWRLELEGADVGERWRPVAHAWAAHTDDHTLAFNDLHAALAAARSPDPDDAPRLVRSLTAYERAARGHNRTVTAEVGRRLVEGMLHYGAGRDAEAIEAILPVRYEAQRIGGSHAQRDIVNLTLIAAAERSGQWKLARALLGERAAIRPSAKVRARYERARERAS